MALGKRVLRPVRLVLKSDTAVALNANFDAYVAADYDPAKLELVPGETPTVFVVQQLTSTQKLRVYAEGSAFAQCTAALRYGLIGLEGYQVLRPDGGVDVLPPPEREPAEGGSAVKLKWLEEANLPMDHIYAVGSVVMSISEAKAPLSRPSATPSGPGGLSA